ncbi:MAG: envelope integrity protein Cei [Actinophytocola sp.]|uniref:envelope integrity protein Cei n=1 Tax=Actinophytocola sp. TaxID=1872138 RepID=UPI003C7522E0
MGTYEVRLTQEGGDKVAAGNVMQVPGRRYRKRRPLPAFVLILVLGVAATVVWLKVMNEDNEVTGAQHCAPPPAQTSPAPGKPPPPTLGKPLEPAALDRTEPAAPSSALVRVVNASGQRGQARMVTEALRGLGFTQVGDPANDVLYGEKMPCHAQIRFGPQGTAAARTISLVEPCAELVRDDRKDATVDVALGETFDDLRLSTLARNLLEQLNDFAKQNPPTQGGLQADAPQPELDPSLLSAARNVKC